MNANVNVVSSELNTDYRQVVCDSFNDAFSIAQTIQSRMKGR
jgi:hypothetical protein